MLEKFDFSGHAVLGTPTQGVDAKKIVSDRRILLTNIRRCMNEWTSLAT